MMMVALTLKGAKRDKQLQRSFAFRVYRYRSSSFYAHLDPISRVVFRDFRNQTFGDLARFIRNSLVPVTVVKVIHLTSRAVAGASCERKEMKEVFSLTD